MVEKVIYNSAKKRMEIDGEIWVMKHSAKPDLKGHNGNTIFERADSDYESRMEKVADYIAKNTPDLKIKDFILEAIRNYPSYKLKHLEQKMKGKAKPRVQKGCLTLDVGGTRLTVVE